MLLPSLLWAFDAWKKSWKMLIVQRRRTQNTKHAAFAFGWLLRRIVAHGLAQPNWPPSYSLTLITGLLMLMFLCFCRVQFFVWRVQTDPGRIHRYFAWASATAHPVHSSKRMFFRSVRDRRQPRWALRKRIPCRKTSGTWGNSWSVWWFRGSCDARWWQWRTIRRRRKTGRGSRANQNNIIPQNIISAWRLFAPRAFLSRYAVLCICQPCHQGTKTSSFFCRNKN